MGEVLHLCTILPFPVPTTTVDATDTPDGGRHEGLLRLHHTEKERLYHAYHGV